MTIEETEKRKLFTELLRKHGFVFADIETNSLLDLLIQASELTELTETKGLRYSDKLEDFMPFMENKINL